VRLFTQEDGLRGDQVTALATSSELVCAASIHVVSGETQTKVYAGVSIFKPFNQSGRTYTTRDGLASEMMQCLAADGKTIWIGTNWGLNRFDSKGRNWSTYTEQDGLPDNSVNTIAFRGGGKVWVGTNGGLCVLDRDSESFSVPDITGPVDCSIHQIAAAGDQIWLVTVRGAVLIDALTGKATWYTTNNGLPSNHTTAVTTDGRYTWVGTSDKLARLDSHTGELLTIGEEDGLPSNSVKALCLDRNQVWIRYVQATGRI